MKKIFGTLFLMLLSIAFVQAQTADEIASKYVEAIGGASNWQSIKTRKMDVTMFTSGIQLAGVVYEDSSNRQKVEFSFQGMKIIQAYDGETAWAQSPPQGMPQPTKLTGPEAEAMKGNEFLNEFVNYKKRGMQLELKGEEDINGKSHYRIDLTTPSGKTTQYFFDKESYLVTATKEMSAVGQEATSYLSDYKEFGGINVPTKVKVMVGGIEVQSLQINSVETNVEIADNTFAFPGN